MWSEVTAEPPSSFAPLFAAPIPAIAASAEVSPPIDTLVSTPFTPAVPTFPGRRLIGLALVLCKDVAPMGSPLAFILPPAPIEVNALFMFPDRELRFMDVVGPVPGTKPRTLLFNPPP